MFTQVNARQETEACQKLMLRKSSPRKKSFLSKQFFLKPAKSSCFNSCFDKFC